MVTHIDGYQFVTVIFGGHKHKVMSKQEFVRGFFPSVLSWSDVIWRTVEMFGFV